MHSSATIAAYAAACDAVAEENTENSVSFTISDISVYFHTEAMYPAYPSRTCP